jgi:hypothetical protein
MKNPAALNEFLFGIEHGNKQNTLLHRYSAFSSKSYLRHPSWSTWDHEKTGFAAKPSPSPKPSAPVQNSMKLSGSQPSTGAMSSARGGAAPSATNPNGYNQFPDPEVKGIDPAVEISRINNNILIYNGVIIAAAVGIGVTMCMFVRSILKPAKGYHGGDSDNEMDSDDDSSADTDES